MPDRLTFRLVAAVGVVAGIWGVAYDINGATQAKAEVTVAVHARPGAVLQVSGTTPAGAAGSVFVQDSSEPYAPYRLTIPGIPTDTIASSPSGLEGQVIPSLCAPGALRFRSSCSAWPGKLTVSCE